MNGGSKPSKPKPAPPTPAPPQVDPLAGDEQAVAGNRRRKGMRSTIISQMAQQQGQQTLGASTALGRMGQGY
jgi:hypothetical protein